MDLRVDLNRIICEYEMRLSTALLRPHILVYLALECGDDAALVLAIARCDVRRCCVTAVDFKFNNWLRRCARVNPAKVKAVKKATSFTILKTEIDNGWNQRRERRKGQRARCVRRQCASFLCGRAKQRWLASAKGMRSKLKSLSPVPFGVFKQTLDRKLPSRRGSNPKFKWLNERLAALRSAGSTGRLDTERKYLAQQYDASQNARGWISQQRQEFRDGLVDRRPPALSGLASLPAIRLPTTHFGNGSSDYPTDPDDVAETIRELGGAGGRNGIRAPASKLLEEGDLIVPPVAKRLKIPQAMRSCCWKAHPGFCEHDDADLFDVYVDVLHNLRRYETLENVGKVYWHFLGASEPDEPEHGIHACFSGFRQHPKYHARYTVADVQRVEDDAVLPYRAIDEHLGSGKIFTAIGVNKARRQPRTLSSWELATLLCRTYLDVRIVAQRLEFQPTVIPREVIVHGKRVVYEDLAVRSNDGEDDDDVASRPLKPRRFRCAELFQKSAVDTPRQEDDHVSKRRRTALKVMGGSVVHVAGETETAWWHRDVPALATHDTDVSAGSGGESSDDSTKAGVDKHLAEMKHLEQKLRLQRRKRSRPAQPAFHQAIVIEQASGSAGRASKGERGELWGPFALAVVYKKGVPNGWSCTCNTHVADGHRCNKTVTTASNLTLDQCRVRIKEWFCQGILIDDGVVNENGKNVVQQHMTINPRRFCDEDLDEAFLDSTV